VEQRKLLRQSSRKALNILYLNAQSIVKKVGELRCVADMLKPDIILVTESWCIGNISDAYLSLDGNELIPDLRMDRENTAGGSGGGLLVYAKMVFKFLNSTK
jgi:hypothetical protein